MPPGKPSEVIALHQNRTGEMDWLTEDEGLAHKVLWPGLCCFAASSSDTGARRSHDACAAPCWMRCYGMTASSAPCVQQLRRGSPPAGELSGLCLSFHMSQAHAGQTWDCLYPPRTRLLDIGACGDNMHMICNTDLVTRLTLVTGAVAIRNVTGPLAGSMLYVLSLGQASDSTMQTSPPMTDLIERCNNCDCSHSQYIILHISWLDDCTLIYAPHEMSRSIIPMYDSSCTDDAQG